MKNTIGFVAIIIFCISLFMFLPSKTRVLTFSHNEPLSFVETYNSKVNLIKTFKADIEADNKVVASIIYDKENFKIKFIANSKLGKEMDIGVNEHFFWFWSKRFDSRLYYADKNEIQNCNLKPQFNPKFIIKTLGIEPISSSIRTSNGQLAFEELDRMVYLCNILGDFKTHYLYDNNKIIAYSSVLETQVINDYVMVKKMKLSFPDENITINWTFKNIEINKDMKDQNWELPNLSPKIKIRS